MINSMSVHIWLLSMLITSSTRHRLDAYLSFTTYPSQAWQSQRLPLEYQAALQSLSPSPVFSQLTCKPGGEGSSPVIHYVFTCHSLYIHLSLAIRRRRWQLQVRRGRGARRRRRLVSSWVFNDALSTIPFIRLHWVDFAANSSVAPKSMLEVE